MKKPIIVTRLKVTQFTSIKTLAEGVYESLHLNPNFVNPQPPMPVFLAALAELRTALENWGVKGNRGSHADYLKLKVAASRMHRILTHLAAWCMASLDPALPYPEQRVLLATTGYPLKRDGSPQGRLESVEGLQPFFTRNQRQGYIQIRWKKPLNVTTRSNVKSYLIYRGPTFVFSDAQAIASVTKTNFTEAPGIGKWFYWVVGVNHEGHGTLGNAAQVEVFLPAQ